MRFLAVAMWFLFTACWATISIRVFHNLADVDWGLAFNGTLACGIVILKMADGLVKAIAKAVRP
jgi:hypothetical protein